MIKLSTNTDNSLTSSLNMADSRHLTAVQKKNCGGDDNEAFLRVVPPPRKTGFNPFGRGKSKKWADDEVMRVVRCLGAKVKKIFYQKKEIRNGVFVCTGVLVWFDKGGILQGSRKCVNKKL